jgi:sugar phosphate isomerase/epimerase
VVFDPYGDWQGNLDVAFDLNRRAWITTAAGAGALAIGTPRARGNVPADLPRARFGIGLNTSTIRGQKLPVTEEVDLVAAAGYDGIEPWIRELDEYASSGGSLEDLGKRIADRGLVVYSAIGFFDWAVDDDARRGKALTEARRNMEMVRKIGGKRIAAPPAGVTDVSGIDLRRLAERYRALLEVGESVGVTPELEIWGFSKTISRLDEASYIAIAADHPRACVLADIYHLYKGGSPMEAVRLLSQAAMPVFHVNDYPDIPRDKIVDADRVFPGDGVGPLPAVFRALASVGFDGMLSLELFNPEYWKQDPKQVLATGLARIRDVIQQASA